MLNLPFWFLLCIYPLFILQLTLFIYDCMCVVTESVYQYIPLQSIVSKELNVYADL